VLFFLKNIIFDTNILNNNSDIIFEVASTVHQSAGAEHFASNQES